MCIYTVKIAKIYENSISLLFYIKRSKVDRKKTIIHLRITVNARRSEFSIKRKISLDKWNSSSNKVRGFSKEAQEVNQYIDLITNKIYKIHQQFITEDKSFTAIDIRDTYLGKNENHKMLLEIFQNHNNQIEKLIGKDYVSGTDLRYKTAKSHVEEFIKFEYKVNDIPVKDVDHKFITGLEYYLKSERNCAHNTIIKYITNFKKVVHIAYANDWISKDSFFNWKGRLKTVDREFLSEDEIQNMIEKNFTFHV